MTQRTAATESDAPDEVIALIRKLFALAGSPNEHEAALALEKAHALLLRYNLRAETVTSGPGNHTDAVTGVWIPGFGGYRWRPELLGILAYHMFCHPLRTRDQVVLVGRPTNIAATRALFAWLASQLERLCLEEFERQPGPLYVAPPMLTIDLGVRGDPSPVGSNWRPSEWRAGTRRRPG